MVLLTVKVIQYSMANKRGFVKNCVIKSILTHKIKNITATSNEFPSKILISLSNICNIAHVKTTKSNNFLLKNNNYLLKKLHIQYKMHKLLF